MGWVIFFVAAVILIIIYNVVRTIQYDNLEQSVLSELNFPTWQGWPTVPYFDTCVTVNSRQAIEKYDAIKFFKEHREKLKQAEDILSKKSAVAETLRSFLANNNYKTCWQYDRIEKQIREVLHNASSYRIKVTYTSPAGKKIVTKEIIISQSIIDRFKADPSLLMSKGEYNSLLREQQKAEVQRKQHEYYGKVNSIIADASKNKASITIKGQREEMNDLVAQLYDKTVNSIQKIKTADSEEWETIGNFIDHIKGEVYQIIETNQKVLAYYASPDFLKIKETCEALMSSQRDFNEYIAEKVESIPKLLGTRAHRNSTVHNDVYHYIRPYETEPTPFTAELSAQGLESAERNPLEYVVKCFYPRRDEYPEQIQNLYQLVEELETLRDAKQIIENYKADYRQYLSDVPAFIMDNDEAGFYSRLGFTNIDESVLTVEYKFVYTSGGGRAGRSFTVPMTEENIAELIKRLESRLTASAFAKEQRTLMTKKLRESIKKRDNFTCCNCGNSTYVEPNLLLEIDHIIPVAKGGRTEESNLQTLCWRCNRAKGAKITA